MDAPITQCHGSFYNVISDDGLPTLVLKYGESVEFSSDLSRHRNGWKKLLFSLEKTVLFTLEFLLNVNCIRSQFSALKSTNLSKFDTFWKKWKADTHPSWREMLLNTTQHNTTQHNTTQHNTAQHNTTQHNTTSLSLSHWKFWERSSVVRPRAGTLNLIQAFPAMVNCLSIDGTCCRLGYCGIPQVVMQADTPRND